MTATAHSRPAASTGGPARPTRIGQIRPSHLMTQAGVGAVVDLPNLSAIVRGLDAWPREAQTVVAEPRLLGEVRRRLGNQVTALKTAPWDPDDDEWSRNGVPVTPFPGWVRCPACFRLGRIDGSTFALFHRSPRRPDLAKIIHAVSCPRQQNRRDFRRRACIPARFLVACERGHLDDFPYDDFVHRAGALPCSGPRLHMSDAASTLTPQVTIKCLECNNSRSIAEVTGERGRGVLPLCRGRHPHLQTFRDCGEPLRLMVVGASNLWFGLTASALHLPSERHVGDEVAAHWNILGTQTSKQLVGVLIDGLEDLKPLRSFDLDAVWAVIEAIRAQGGPAANDDDKAEPGDLLTAEWELLSHPTTEREDADFRARPTPVPPTFADALQQVVLVSRLREVRALLGFTRIAAPEGGAVAARAKAPLAREAPTWVPAVEQRGEGIFLEFREDRMREWEQRVAGHERFAALVDSWGRYALPRDLPTLPPVPVARYTLLHTISHLLIRQMALECGYSSASIRERLYIGSADQPAAGVLLSTAASDSEGTLGGLVALGRAAELGRLMESALEDAERCSSDPLCAEHVPASPSMDLHAAACHACLFASETTCEVNNRWLDRAVLVDLTGDALAFLR